MKTASLVFEKETANTFKYRAEDAGETIVGAVYIKKAIFGKKHPKSMKVSIHWDHFKKLPKDVSVSFNGEVKKDLEIVEKSQVEKTAAKVEEKKTVSLPEQESDETKNIRRRVLTEPKTPEIKKETRKNKRGEKK